MLTDPQAQALADKYGQAIADMAQAQFDQMIEMIQSGATPRDAIRATQAQFGVLYSEQVAAAFSELLARSVGSAEVRAMPVGDIPLSRALYLRASAVESEVTAIVRAHTNGVQEARALAMRLYDGYDPGDGIVRPLEGSARADLPKWLRALTEDRRARTSLAQIIERGQAQAARLKSQALRAGYTELLDAWESGAATGALNRKLDNAVREKNRYFAERIARTELARAHMAQRAGEFLGDESIDVVQVVINPRHPVSDICDLHGRANLYGMGEGCYPKAKAPRPPYHPHCLCALRSRPSLSASDARPLPGGAAAYLRDLPEDKAAAVAGSRERLQRILQGADVLEVVDAGKPAAYRTVRLGDPQATQHALITPPARP